MNKLHSTLWQNKKNNNNNNNKKQLWIKIGSTPAGWSAERPNIYVQLNVRGIGRRKKHQHQQNNNNNNKNKNVSSLLYFVQVRFAAKKSRCLLSTQQQHLHFDLEINMKNKIQARRHWISSTSRLACSRLYSYMCSCLVLWRIIWVVCFLFDFVTVYIYV